MRSPKSWGFWSEYDLRADAREVRRLVDLLPARWAAYVGVEYEKRGGAWDAGANAWALKVMETAPGRVPLSSSDDDLRELAARAAAECRDVAKLATWAAGNAGGVSDAFGRAFFAARAKTIGDEKTARGMMDGICRAWGIEPPKVNGCGEMPAVRRMCCARWWLRRLRRSHGRLSLIHI